DQVSDVDIFDPAKGTWTKGPQFPGEGFGLAAASANHAVYISGQTGHVYRASAALDQWQDIGTLAFPRMFHRIVAGDRAELIALGGAGRGTHLRQAESFPLAPSGKP